MITRRKALPIRADASKCTGCLICELRCSLRLAKAFSPAKSALKIRRLVGTENEYKISFDDRCDNCGICVPYCSYGALTQEKKKRKGA